MPSMARRSQPLGPDMPFKPAHCSQSLPPDIPSGPNIPSKPSKSNSAAEVLAVVWVAGGAHENTKNALMRRKRCWKKLSSGRVLDRNYLID
ncbi:hypothetical protein BDZ91DRAFT_721353 [Kalaharituber pfeilii]|nr:hypothetical protein BDZ91DRAFT_721353 [Kalaharituber pfeilii]